MGKNRIKPNYRRRVLRLPDLDHCKTSVSIASDHPHLAASTSMPLTNSSPGTAPNLDSLSTVSSSFAIACTWNQEGWPRTPSTSSSPPCVVLHTKLPTQACSVPSWRRASAESRELNNSAFVPEIG